RFGSMAELIGLLEPHAVPPLRASVLPRARPLSATPTPTHTRIDSLAPTIRQDPAAAPDSMDREATPKGRRRLQRRSVIGLAGAFGAIALVTAAVTLRSRHVHAPPSKEAAGAAVRLLDLPMPSAQNPAALAAYMAGMQALHDDDRAAASRSFEEAAGL